MSNIALDYEGLSDLELAALVVRRDTVAVRLITQRNNQRLYRAAWSILKHRGEAEDAVQEAYLKAFAAMGSFEGHSSLSTWLTRIAVNEALERRRVAARRERLLAQQSVTLIDDYRETLMAGSGMARSPEADLMRRQVAKLLEGAVAKLSDTLRPVFMLRDVEGLSVEETADILKLPKNTVKTRLLRARRLLQKELDPELHEALRGTFPFAGADCDALTARVLEKFQAN